MCLRNSCTMESGRKKTLTSSSILFVIAACMGVTLVDANLAARFEASSESINPDTEHLNLTCSIGSSEKETYFQIRNTVNALAAIDVYIGTQDFGNDFQVEGNVLDPLREFFLRVIIPNPMEADAGNYSCLVHVEREDSLILETTVQWLDDSMLIQTTLMGKVESLETELAIQKHKHESELKVLKTEYTDMKSKLQSFKDQVSSVNAKCTTEIEHQRKQMEIQHIDMKSKLQSFKDEVSSVNAKLTSEIEHQRKQMEIQPPPMIAFSVRTPVQTELQRSTLKFKTVTLNEGNNYNKTNGHFTAPRNGIYVFHMTVTTKKVGYLGVRLSGGPGPWQGRLEVENERNWGTVCNDHFDWKELKVVCPSMGYSDGRIIKSAPRGPWNYKHIMMDNLGCEPWETRLRDCPHRGWGRHDCDHGEDITLSCYGTLTRRPREYGIFFLIVKNSRQYNVKIHSWETGSISTVAQLNAGDNVKPWFEINEDGVFFNEEGTHFSGHLLTPL